MEEFEARLKSLPLLKPSADFGTSQAFARLVDKCSVSIGVSRIAHPRRRFAAAAILATCCLVAFAAVLMGMNDSRVLAQAVGKVLAATSLTFDTVVEVDGKIVDKTREFYMPPGLYRHYSTSPGYDESFAVISVPADGLMRVNLKKRTAELCIFSSEWGQGYLKQTLIETLRGLDITNAKSLGEKTIDGVRTHGFEIIGGNSAWNDAKFVVWADPKTSNPLRVEVSAKDNAGRDILNVWSNIVFGETLDPQLFSLNVPDGYKLVPFEGYPIETSSPAGLVAAFLKLYASQSQGRFPTSLVDAYPDLVKGVGGRSDSQLTEAAAKVTFLGQTTATVMKSGKQGEAWEYYPGRKPGRSDQVLFWNFDESSATYLVVFADFHMQRLNREKLFELLDDAGVK
jgi:outer membrane lipoprotein-sorting protein